MLCEPTLTLTQPELKHGEGMHQLVKHTGVLDVNSAYAYLLICRDFANTSIIAECDDDVVGMVTGYVPPSQDDTLFIWQVAVHDSMRGQGLAGKMFDQLLENAESNIQKIETTVSPSNFASRRMFEKLADKLDTHIYFENGFPEELFPDNHEAEPLLRIGPFDLEEYQGAIIEHI